MPKSIKQHQAILSFDQMGYKLPEPTESVQRNAKYVTWGDDNRYPEFIYDLYQNTALFQSLVNNLEDYVMGQDIYLNSGLKIVNKSGEDLEAFVRKCVNDLILYNMIIVQRIYSPLHELKEVYHLPVRRCRLSEDSHKLYYSKNWGKWGSKAIEFSVDDPTAASDVIVYKAPTSDVYATPFYTGALKSITILNKVTEFHLNNISNGFAASAIINFNGGVPDEEQKSTVESALKDKFAGESNAGKFVLSWNESKENETTISKLSDDSFDKKFDTLYSNSKQDVILGFRCPSLLIGSIDSQTGFNSIEYQQAYKLYNTTAVIPMQNKVKSFIDRLFGEGQLNIVPFSLAALDENNE